MPKIKYVKARYIGQNQIILMKGQGTGRNADGSKRDTRAISQGDVILMPEYEIAGYTLLFDPQGNNSPKDLGAGRRILPEHIKFKDDERELSVAGYEFHMGRIDFELVVDPPVVEEAPTKVKGGKAS